MLSLSSDRISEYIYINFVLSHPIQSTNHNRQQTNKKKEFTEGLHTRATHKPAFEKCAHIQTRSPFGDFQPSKNRISFVRPPLPQKTKKKPVTSFPSFFFCIHHMPCACLNHRSSRTIPSIQGKCGQLRLSGANERTVNGSRRRISWDSKYRYTFSYVFLSNG